VYEMEGGRELCGLTGIIECLVAVESKLLSEPVRSPDIVLAGD
jgi:hypothetical protein